MISAMAPAERPPEMPRSREEDASIVMAPQMNGLYDLAPIEPGRAIIPSGPVVPASDFTDENRAIDFDPPGNLAPDNSITFSMQPPTSYKAAPAKHNGPKPSVGYTAEDLKGYSIYTPYDLPYEEDIEQTKNQGNAEVPKDKDAYRGPLIVMTATFFLVLVTLLVWLGLIARCQVQGLCDKADVSGNVDTDYAFRTFPFLVPFVYVWASLSAGVLGLLVISLYALSILKRNTGTARMVEIASFIREGAVAFLALEYGLLVVLVLVLFVLLFFGANLRVAFAYLIGASLSAITGYAGMSIATRGNVRTAAAAAKSMSLALNVAFRSGAVMGMAVVSIGLSGLSAVYLMMSDVRSLAGFSAGASTVALFARVGGGIFTKAADVGADLVGKVEANIPEDDPRNPATIADNVGDNVGDVAGMGADLFESYVGSVVATAILGASLPFFWRNPMALCVYNHLYIDQLCGPFDYPNRLSYAVSICESNDFYTEYPYLSIWASNSIFVALPFMLMLVGLLASIICTVHVIVPDSAKAGGERAQIMDTLLWSLRFNVFGASLLIIAGAAGLCWGFFGGNSTFQSFQGFSGNADLPVFELAPNLTEACIPRSVAGQPNLFPGGFLNPEGRYHPIDTLGFSFGSAYETPWRLFLSIIIGLFLGIVIGLLTEYFTAGNYPPTQQIAESGQYGAGAVVIQGLGVGMLSTVLPLSLVVAVILGAYALFGTYGIALAAVGMLSTLGVTMATDAYGPVADNAGGIAEMAELPSSVRDTTDALDALGNTTAATGKGFSNGSAVLTAYALLTALVQDSGLAPTPYDVVSGRSHILDYNVVRINDIYVVVSVFIGIMLPYLFAALTMLAVSRAAQAMIVEVRRQFREIPGLREGRPGVKPEHVRCVSIATRSAIFEMILPGAIAILSPLIIGFGFGQKALVGLLLAAIGSGYMLGIMMSNGGGAWDNAKKLVESGFFGKSHAKGSEWHKATVAGDTVGDPFKDTSGPSMNILIKMMTVFGLVTVTLMHPDQERGWIGLIIFLVALLFAGIFVFWNTRSSQKIREEASRIDNGFNPAPKKVVSDFFNEGPRVDEETIFPGSQMWDAFHAAGGRKGMKKGLFTNPSTLPGLYEGDTVRSPPPGGVPIPDTLSTMSVVSSRR